MSTPSIPPTKASTPMLDEIIRHKRQEVKQQQAQLPLAQVHMKLSVATRAKIKFLEALKTSQRSPSLIAEVKQASPSKGLIRADFDPVAIAQAYERAGAACISVLTDRQFFKGSFEHLRAVRQKVSLPLLCKEFVVDAAQIYWARAVGADAVLLIAAVLSDRELRDFLRLAHDLEMEALVEVHTQTELERVLSLPQLALVGINNRNLTNFSVDLSTTQQLMAAYRNQLSDLGVVVVSESGLHTAADLKFVAETGIQAVLVGESLLRQPDVEQAVHHLFADDPSYLSDASSLTVPYL
jgi:indole-3-glycerol phosphate synthase